MGRRGSWEAKSWERSQESGDLWDSGLGAFWGQVHHHHSQMCTHGGAVLSPFKLEQKCLTVTVFPKLALTAEAAAAKRQVCLFKDWKGILNSSFCCLGLQAHGWVCRCRVSSRNPSPDRILACLAPHSFQLFPHPTVEFQ